MPVILRSPTNGWEVKVNAFIDTGSDGTIISDRVRRAINLPAFEDQVGLGGVGSTKMDYRKAWFCSPLEVISMQNGHRTLCTEALCLRSSCLDGIDATDFSDEGQKMRIPIPKPVKTVWGDNRVDVLIGLDLDEFWFWTHTRKSGNFRAVKSDMGWMITKVPDKSGPTTYDKKIAEAKGTMVSNSAINHTFESRENGNTFTSSSKHKRTFTLRRYKRKVNTELRSLVDYTVPMLTDDSSDEEFPDSDLKSTLQAKSDKSVPASDNSVPEADKSDDVTPSISPKELKCNFVNQKWDGKYQGKDVLSVELQVPLNSQDREGIDKTQKALLECIRHDLAKHWATEEFKDDKGYTAEEQRCLDLINNSYRNVDGRAYVSPIWKEGQPEPGLNTFGVAKARLMNVHKKLDDVGYKSLDDVFQEYLKAGIIEKVDISISECFEQDGIYWPMFPVARDSETTPIRPVMDGAAKIIDGMSINQKCFSAGPCLINDLSQVLTRFRRYNIGFMGDISKMFLKVLVPEEDRKYYRFLWISRDGSEIYVYQFKGHLFGNNGSPTVAIFATQRNARDFQDKYPEAVEVILHDTIVDDHLSSAPTADDVVRIYENLRTIHDNIGLKLAKCATNSKEVSERLPEGLTKSEKMVSFDSYVAEPTLAPGTESKMPHVRTLGQQWNMVEDKFTYGSIEPDKRAKWSKVSVLSQAHKIFDPLGFIAPIMLGAKCFLRTLWSRAADWKDPLTKEELSTWEKWLTNLPKLQKLSFDRVLMPGLPENFKKVTLHVFSDASKTAIAAVAYLRVEYKDNTGTYINYVQSKSRLVPIKINRTIPKLELESIYLASTLAAHIAAALRMELADVILWSDSKTALQWIRMDPNYLQVFCHNQVSKIISKFERPQIRWVPGESNPSDIATRELSFNEFEKRLDLWRSGPKFLLSEENSWPTLPILENTSEVMQEVKKEFKLWKKDFNCFQLKTRSQVKIERASEVNDYTIDVSRFSSFTKLRRSFAYALRFIDNCRAKVDTKLPFRSGNLSVDELQRAGHLLASRHQELNFKNELDQLEKGILPMSSPLRRLGAERHTESLLGGRQVTLLRLGGRTRFAKHLNRETRCPVLIKPGDRYADLLISHFHTKVLNHSGGIKCLLCEINRSYWIFGSIANLKRILNECVECRKAAPIPKLNVMAPLPDERVPGGDVITTPFTTTAIDAAGPWTTVQGRGKARVKRWLLIYRCALTGVIHLDMLYDMSETSFLKSLERFVSRHLKPKVIYCDLGTNFVGGSNTMKRIWEKAERALDTVEFRFAPGEAPNFMGLVERVVGMVKRALRPILKDRVINDEDLYTYFTMVEKIINDRPLAWRSAPDSKDPEPVTPNHFLLKGRIGETLLPVKIPQDGKLSSSIKVLESLATEFYRRFVVAILPTLREYNKRWLSTAERTLAVGDVVLILEDDLPIQGRYPLGLVTNLSLGRDGFPRRFEIRVGRTGRTITRALNKLVKLVNADNAIVADDNRLDNIGTNTRSRTKARKRRENARLRCFFVH